MVACLSGLAAAAKVAIYGKIAGGDSDCERAVPVFSAHLRAKDNAAMVIS